MRSKNYLKIGITADFQKELPGLIEPICSEIFGSYSFIKYEFFDSPPVAIAEQIDQYDAIISYHINYMPTSFNKIKRLSVISRWGVGYDKIDVAACTKANVLLTIVPREVVKNQVAIGILAFIFALNQKVLQKNYLAHSGKWLEKANVLGEDISNKTLGSIGIGNIGSELFRLSQSLGFKQFLATDPYVEQNTISHLNVRLVDLKTLLKKSDIVTINCPLNQETRGMIGQKELALMKDSAFLINTARGPIINEIDLVNALESNLIAGGAFDVFEHEPLMPSHPLCHLNNVILSPHSIAFTDRLVNHNSLYACRNIISVVKKSIDQNSLVNPEVLNTLSFENRMQQLQKLFS
ncbi:MAG: hypothetical protein H6655_12670 [Ardenticatenaceae bacterium]|nr:hypothetical protein [Ardenticatenaceae bacterium]